MSILNKIIKKEDETEEKVAKTQTKKTVVKKEKKSGSKEIPLHHFDILVRPHISEKAFDINANGQYVFVVSAKANKVEIGKAVENFYKVPVSSVNIVNIPGKRKLYKGRPVTRSGFKKAVVTLKKGHTIDVMEASK